MNYVTINYNRLFDYLEKFKSDNLGLYFSIFLHFLILISIIGLPNFFGPKEILIPNIIPIEIINISDVTSMPKEIIEDAKPIETKEVKEVKIKDVTSTPKEIIEDEKLIETKEVKIKIEEKKFNSSENQEIKKINIRKKYKIKENVNEIKNQLKENKTSIIEEKREDKVKLKKEKIEIKTDNFESLPTKKLKPKLKPKNKSLNNIRNKKTDVATIKKPLENKKVAIIKKPLESKKVLIKEKYVEEIDYDTHLATTLKDIRNEIAVEKKEDITENKNEEESNINAKLTISERDLFFQQLKGCNRRDMGIKRPKGGYVVITASIRQNRTVIQNSIQIVDTNISDNEDVYKQVTESAMRVLLHPDCSILKLPEEKYEQWKNIRLVFDDKF